MKTNDLLKMTEEAVGGGYGLLYNGIATTDADFAPTDWKVATTTEYSALATALGGTNFAGGKMKEAGLLHWDSPNRDADNSSGFTALGSGIRYNNGNFLSLKQGAFFATEADNFFYNLSYVSGSIATVILTKNYGISARLVYIGAGIPASTLVDYDGNSIAVALMADGNYWTVENWKCTHLKTGVEIVKITDSAAWQSTTKAALCAFDNDDNKI